MGEILPEVANSGENGERTKTWTTMFGVDVSVVVDAFDVVFFFEWMYSPPCRAVDTTHANDSFL